MLLLLQLNLRINLLDLILVRHAQAEISYPDEKRNLTQSGIVSFQKNCRTLKNEIGNIDLILSSPLTRAVQTGDILSNEFELKDHFYIEKELSPGCNSESVKNLIDIYDVNKLACVFHMPDISYNFYKFCPTNKEINFNPGSIAVISFDEKAIPGKGKLKLYIP